MLVLKNMFKKPKNVKYKKIKKGKLSRLEFKSNDLVFGDIGLKALESGMISARQIEAARRAITRKLARSGKVWVKIFPDLPITKKPVGVRMGKGVGNISHWVARVRGGTVLFEITKLKNFNTVFFALKAGGNKLPIKTKVFN